MLVLGIVNNVGSCFLTCNCIDYVERLFRPETRNTEQSIQLTVREEDFEVADARTCA